jgi:hypothetical protein
MLNVLPNNFKHTNQIYMKSNRILICLGLFLISVSLITKHYQPVPDFFQGYTMGTGMGLEILGLVRFSKMKRRNASVQCKN